MGTHCIISPLSGASTPPKKNWGPFSVQNGAFVPYGNIHRPNGYSESANAETKASAMEGAWAAEMKLHSNCDGAM